MGYNDWQNITDSTEVLGNIQDEDPSQSVEGTIVNTSFLSTYIGQRFVDLASVLGPSPQHAASSVYRAGGRSGFPLFQIPSDSPEVTNDTNTRYCQVEEDIDEMFEHGDIGDGEQLLGTFTARFFGSGFLAEWNGLRAYQTDNLKYSVLVPRGSPNRSYGTIPPFAAGGGDSSNFEVSFEPGSAGSGSGLAGNVSVFGNPGSGAEFTDWETLVSTVESSLDSTSQHTVFVMPGTYDVSSLVWKAREHRSIGGSIERYNQYKLRVPSYLHVVGLDRNSVVFRLDSTDLFMSQGTFSNSADSTVAGGNPGLFLAQQFSSINNLRISVNNQIVSPDPRAAIPAPIRFVCDSSTPYMSNQEDFSENDISTIRSCVKLKQTTRTCSVYPGRCNISFAFWVQATRVNVIRIVYKRCPCGVNIDR